MPGFDFTGGVLPAGATLTRSASSWSRIKSDKLMELGTAADVARFDYDPITGTLRGLLVEPAATNRIPQPNALDQPPWGAFGSGAVPSVAANNRVAPDGSMTADSVTLPDVPAGGFAVLSHGGSALSAQTYAASVYSQSSTSGAKSFISATPNGSQFAGRAAMMSTTVWARTSFTFLADSSTWYIEIGTDARDAQQTATPASVTGFWGVQLEAGDRPTTFTINSRSADVLTLNWGAKGIGDGTPTVTYTFDDGSMQAVATTISNGLAVVPTSLNRSRIRFATIPEGIITPAARTGILYDRAPRRGTLFG